MLSSIDPILVKLIDFGFAEPINEKKLKSGQGTAGYIAPEIFKLQPFTKKSDIFSIGVILFAILSNTSPFQS
jgi:serine/threonine protein kinase